MEIIITPSFNFRIYGNSKETSQIAEIFNSSRAKGLLELIKRPALRLESLSAAYWNDFANIFMRSFCTYSTIDPLHIPITATTISNIATAAPLTEGAEYISSELLTSLWQELEFHINSYLNDKNITARQFITTEFPDWKDVGKIHFHLAENKQPDSKPFAFLSTYGVRVPGKARIQHRPLGVALKKSLSSSDKSHLQQLLRPIYEASKTSKFVAKSLKNQSIYAPFYLNPNEAFHFIQDIPYCEEAGIICKLPAWWNKGRPPKAQVAVKLGTKKKSQISFNQLLNFKIGLSIDGKTLTESQTKELLAAESSLIEIDGKWIEVNRKHIEQILSVWNNAVSASHNEGISFAQAMRLMSRFSLNNDNLDKSLEAEEIHKWIDISTSSELTNLLDNLRKPKDPKHPQLEKILETYLKGTLRPYQKSGLEWLRTITSLQLGGCLADDMGLGKTIQVIAMLLTQKHYLKVKKTSLLIVPASLLGNWDSEIQKFAPSLCYKIIHPTADVPKQVLEEGPPNLEELDFILTTYGMAVRMDWLQQQDWQTIIADEAQAIKNSKTKQSKVLRSFQASSKIAMTGTPIENSLVDLWSIFDFTCPGLLGTEAKFKETIKNIEVTGDTKKIDYTPIRTLIAPYILRRKKSDKSVINDLPDKIELTSQCYLTENQATLYQKEVTRLKDTLRNSDGMQRKGLILSSLLKFKQICNHPSQYLANDSYQPNLSGKFSKLKEIVETISSRQEKVLLFTQFRELTDILAHFLSECFGTEGLIIHGGTAVDKRQKLVEKFQHIDGPPFFVLSLKAGGTGLNLTAANHVIHFDRWWNPAVENQATDRAFRIGQKNNVLIHKFVCKGTIEEKIDLMIREKKDLANAIVEKTDEIKFTELSDQELLNLVSLDIQALNES
ncbi:MAG: DEAD/DEAH box helicase [Bdellovibrionota bacterium]